MTVGDCATREVVSVAPGDSIDRAIVLMEEHGIHHLPVLRSERLAGILSDRDILLAVGWELGRQRLLDDYDSIVDPAPQRVEEIMTRAVVRVRSEDSVRHGARLMLDLRIGALPVMQQDQMVGILTETDLLRRLERRAERAGGARELLSLPVGELMRSSVITVEPGATLARLIELLQKRRVRHLPVVLDGALAGIISDRDVRRALGERRRLSLDAAYAAAQPESRELRARDIMTRDVLTVGLHHRISDVVHRLLTRRIHALPVVGDQRALLGIITQTDVVREIARRDLL